MSRRKSVLAIAIIVFEFNFAILAIVGMVGRASAVAVHIILVIENLVARGAVCIGMILLSVEFELVSATEVLVTDVAEVVVWAISIV